MALEISEGEIQLGHEAEESLSRQDKTCRYLLKNNSRVTGHKKSQMILRQYDKYRAKKKRQKVMEGKQN